ncbi:MAG: hypothetical protein CL609_12760 [Anaerolineaceae bacterium]|nr:hypothetical protein [Anaerolineaceae bacterium]
MKTINLEFILKYIRYILLFFIVIYLILLAGFYQGLTVPIVCSMGGLFLIFNSHRLPQKLIPPLAVFLITNLVSVFFSIDPIRSAYQFWLVGLGICLVFTLAVMLSSSDLKKAILVSVVLVATGMMTLSWFDVYRWNITYLQAIKNFAAAPSISYRLNGGNTIAAFYSLIFFLFLGFVFQVKNKLLKGLFSVGALLSFGLIILSSSRGALLGLIGGVSFFIYFLLQNTIHQNLKKLWGNKKLRSIFLVAVLVGFLALITFTIFYFYQASNHPSHGNPLTSRSEFWPPAIRAFFASPLVGKGLYTFASWYTSEVSTPPSQIFLHAHSSYFDILGGTGILGLVSFLWLAFVGGKILLKIDCFKNRNYLGVSAAIFAFAIHSFFDGLYLMIFAGFTFLIYLAYLFSHHLHTESPSIPNLSKKMFSLIFIIPVIGYSWLNYWQNEPLKDAVSLYKEESLPAAQQKILIAKDRNPAYTVNQIYTGLMFSDTSHHITQIALPAFEAAVALDPYWALNHANLAALYRETGNFSNAIQEDTNAVSLAPNWGLYHLNLGHSLEKSGDLTKAEQSYKTALTLNPEWATAYFFRQNEFRTSVVLSTEIVPIDIYETYENQLDQPYAIPLIRRAKQALSDQDISLAQDYRQLASIAYYRREPEKYELHWLDAEILAAQGNYKQAISQAEGTFYFVLRQGVYGPGSAGTSLYYDGVYRAPVLPVEFVPQLTTIPLPGEWEHRYFTLAEWYALNNDSEGCQTTLDQLLSYVPDYLTEYEKSSPCGGK